MGDDERSENRVIIEEGGDGDLLEIRERGKSALSTFKIKQIALLVFKIQITSNFIPVGE